MTITKGIAREFEFDMLHALLNGKVIKCALFADSDALNLSPAIEGSDLATILNQEISSFSEYPAGGVTLNQKITKEDNGSHLDFDDFSFSSFPAGVSISGGLIYNATDSQPIMVVNFGRDYSSTDGALKLTFSFDTRGHYMISVHLGAR